MMQLSPEYRKCFRIGLGFYSSGPRRMNLTAVCSITVNFTHSISTYNMAEKGGKVVGK
jgi:hypothetical protein